MTAEPEPRLADLVSGAVRDVQTLVSGEVELAKAELARSAKRGAAGGGLIGLAIFMALFALLMLAFSAAYGLVAAGLDPWAAFLIIGAVMLLVTAVLGLVAYKQFNKITGPVMAQAELEKTKNVFAARKADAAAARAATAETTASASAPPAEPESTTVFPSYSGTPPAP
jgi:uncharacterized membrane protein YqjE